MPADSKPDSHAGSGARRQEVLGNGFSTFFDWPPEISATLCLDFFMSIHETA